MELTKEDLGYIFEVCVLNFEGEDLYKMLKEIKPKHIQIGKKVLEFIENEI